LLLLTANKIVLLQQPLKAVYEAEDDNTNFIDMSLSGNRIFLLDSNNGLLVLKY
jgi:hypothetical protein